MILSILTLHSHLLSFFLFPVLNFFFSSMFVLSHSPAEVVACQSASQSFLHLPFSCLHFLPVLPAPLPISCLPLSLRCGHPLKNPLLKNFPRLLRASCLCTPQALANTSGDAACLPSIPALYVLPRMADKLPLNTCGWVWLLHCHLIAGFVKCIAQLKLHLWPG